LGVVLGLIDEVNAKAASLLWLLVQPAHLQRVVGRELDQEHRRIERATLIRERLRGT
jgi:protein arginine kinase